MVRLKQMNIKQMERAVKNGTAKTNGYLLQPDYYYGFKKKMSATKYWLEDSENLLCIFYVEDFGLVKYQLYNKDCDMRVI
jgi:hypothetical protein